MADTSATPDAGPTAAAALLLLAVGLTALACALLLDALPTGGRVLATVLGAWGTAVGAAALVHAHSRRVHGRHARRRA